MDSLKIECFLAVAELKSYSKAANMMFRNQSVLSRQVMALEDELGVKLFYRRGRSVSLTPAGKVFEEGIRRLGSIYSGLLSDVQATEKGLSGEIKLCTHPGNLYFRDLVPLVQAFERSYPSIKLSLSTAYSGEVNKQLEDKRIDFVFWRWEEYAGENRDYQNFSSLESGLLVLPDHPMAGRKGLQPTLADFMDDTFIVLPDHIAPKLGQRLVRFCHEAGFSPKVVEAPDLDTSLLWVSARRGIIAMNSNGICADNKAFRYIILPQFGKTDFSFIWEKSNDNPCIGLFLKFAAEYKAGNVAEKL